VDMHSRYLNPPIRNRGWLCLLATALIAISFWAGIGAYREHKRAKRANVISARLLAAQAKTNAIPTRTEQEDQKRWTALIVERDFMWEPLFRAVESTATSNIELLEMHPDKSDRRVILRGEAKDQKALISFLAALASQAALENVHLVREETALRGSLETVTFEIKATLIKY